MFRGFFKAGFFVVVTGLIRNLFNFLFVFYCSDLVGLSLYSGLVGDFYFDVTGIFSVV